MLYLNSNIINKIGNSNRLYYNGSIVYQGYTTGGEPDTPDIPEGDYSLPDVPFLFNYNAKNYSNGVIPNADGASFNYNMVLNNPNVVVYNGDYIAVNGASYFQYQYPSINENPFNCGSSNSQMTIIAKVRTNREDGEMHLFANRSDSGGYGGTYNWMLRIGGGCDVAWLHTSDYNGCSNTVRVPITYDQPNIFAIRLLSDNKGYGQNYTLNEVDEVRDAGFNDYSYSSRIAILNGSFSGEYFFGDFYWLYCSKEQLTDEQIQQVIEYNENKAFEPVVPPVEPEPDEPVIPDVPAENWSVIGDINGEYWVEDVAMTQDTDNPYIYKSEPITFNYEIGQFKIRLDGGWTYQYGSDSADVHNVGEVFDVWKNKNSANIKIYNVPNTPYTIYLDTSNHSVWVEGEIPAAPPAPVVNTWGVVGDLTVGLWDKDIPMELEDDLYVARNVVFADAEGNGCVFKIRQNGNWDVNFGSYGSYWFLYEEIPLYGYGSNIVVADGIVGEPYTIYFNPTTEMLWVEGDSKEPEGYEFRGRAEAKIYSNYINLNFYDDEEQNELSIRLNTTNTDYIELGEWTTTIGDNYIQNIIFNGQTVGLKDIFFYVDEINGDYWIDINNGIQAFNFIGKIDGIMTPSQANQPEEPEIPSEPETPTEPEVPSEVTEFEISSWANTYSSVGEYEMTFMGDGFTIIVDFLVNPITPSTYSLDNGLSNDYTKYNGGNMESCTAIVIDNGDTLNFDVTFIADNINGHFNYSINKNEI